MGIDFSEVLGPPWVGISVTCSVLAGLAMLACAAITGMKEWGCPLNARVRYPVMVWGMFQMWRAWAIWEVQKVSLSACVLAIVSAVVLLLVLLDLVLYCYKKRVREDTQAEDLLVVAKAIAPMPHGPPATEAGELPIGFRKDV